MNDRKSNLPDNSNGDLSALLHGGAWLMSPFSKEIYIGRQTIVGMRFQGGADTLIKDLKPGDKITFLREPENEYDTQAVMAMDGKGRKLGYIPRRENLVMSALMDHGKVFYGVIPDISPEEYAYSRKYPIQMIESGAEIPVTVTVDLYMREFAIPEDVTVIPRHGCDGSYAVLSLWVSEDEPGRIRRLYAIKVINGEERDIFVGRTQGASREEQRKLTDSFRIFAGYLPIVGHDIEDRDIPVLEESYGVLLGIPFSNRVIDTKIMAENHLPGKYDYSLDALTDALGIEVHADGEQERRCRKIWELYRRMECSELVKK